MKVLTELTPEITMDSLKQELIAIINALGTVQTTSARRMLAEKYGYSDIAQEIFKRVATRASGKGNNFRRVGDDYVWGAEKPKKQSKLFIKETDITIPADAASSIDVSGLKIVPAGKRVEFKGPMDVEAEGPDGTKFRAKVTSVIIHFLSTIGILP